MFSVDGIVYEEPGSLERRQWGRPMFELIEDVPETGASGILPLREEDAWERLHATAVYVHTWNGPGADAIDRDRLETYTAREA
jgi:hypothetical protein